MTWQDTVRKILAQHERGLILEAEALDEIFEVLTDNEESIRARTDVAVEAAAARVWAKVGLDYSHR